MDSVWSDRTKIRAFEPLRGDLRTDVLVIGGGIAGVLCAYELAQKGAACVIVEAKRLCGGVTANTTAKITSQHGLIYSKLLRRFGKEKTQMYLQANQAALQRYAELCADIECDFQRRDSFVYSVDDKSVLEDELSALAAVGYRAEYTENTPMPFAVAGAIGFKDQAQFDPLKFVSGIVEGLEIYEHTCVRELIGCTAVTDGGRISASKIIVATHFPFINKHGSYFLKLYQHRSYVLALENAQEVGGMYVDRSKEGLSFRDYDGLLLLGGGSHRTGKHGGSWNELENFAKKHYPRAKVKYRWATQDCMSLDDVPYIGNYSANTPNLYVATGFNKWGMTSSMVGAMLLSDMITGRSNPYEQVFSPSRSVLRPQLAVNGLEAAASLITPTKRRCPHMGCALKWNAHEHTWDCPCHGSRFTEDGKLINNPSTGDMN